jgi:hypothetical protein
MEGTRSDSLTRAVGRNDAVIARNALFAIHVGVAILAAPTEATLGSDTTKNEHETKKFQEHWERRTACE